MTTSILEALIQLFALFAAGQDKNGVDLGRTHAARYMRIQLPKAWADESLERFDELVNQFQRVTGSGEEVRAKRLAKLSVKLLRTCSQINKGLEWHEKHVVVVRLMEYLAQVQDHETGTHFLKTVCDSFALSDEAVGALESMVGAPVSKSRQELPQLFELTDSFLNGRFGGKVIGFHLEEGNLFLLRTASDDVIRVNHQEMPNHAVALLAPGGTLRDGTGSTLFHSELIAHIQRKQDQSEPISLQASNVSHYFQFPSNQALHQFNLEAEGGQLVGIMGGSGSGKSTMLSILNGSVKPSFGKVTINGVDIHEHPNLVTSWIGHVPQDDVLISELTVRENLKFNARLSLANITDEEQESRVNEVLEQLGLTDAADLRVGSVLDKVISGGQRKRLNIGLELLRKPPVLFLDEPTSGLSSRDSEQIMDLLKELTYAGQLVFAVLHQPSSDLFKMLDRLFMLDAGGHPVYWGYPLEAIRHFNTLSSRVHADQVECGSCGNVNPEQLFDIVEAKTVDEYGRKTSTRRTSPKEWNDFFTIILGQSQMSETKQMPPVSRPSHVASGWTQWKTFIQRDALAKWRNRQYLWVNGLEAPALAMLLAGFMRYNSPGIEYTFRSSENIPPFLFISVIVALFLGLSVSAEEILRDRSLLKRERFLNVKWRHYVHAKILVVAAVTLFHSIGFVAVSHTILELPGFALKHVLVLFSVGLFGNLLGLVISSLFRTAKVVYIIIPLLVIPQIIFGGAIIRYERFNPTFSDPDAVPWFGNVMASRWGFEALAVELARNNPFDVMFVDWEDRIYQAGWRRDYWLPELKREEDDNLVLAELEASEDELSVWEGESFTWGWKSAEEVDWSAIKARYNQHYSSAFSERTKRRNHIQRDLDLVEAKNISHNDELWDWVLQDDRRVRALWVHNKIVQKSGPIHRFTASNNALDATMFVPYKNVLGYTLTTLGFNVAALSMMTGWVWMLLLSIPWLQSSSLGSLRLQKSSPQA